MRQIFNLRLVELYDARNSWNTSIEHRLQGELENGNTVTLNRVTYFNSNNGLLYTTKQGYLVMSYSVGYEFMVFDYIEEQLNEIWV